MMTEVSAQPIILDRIEDALEDIRNGKVVIVVDDEDRENEGDFLTAARNGTPEVINFMATHGRGLICTPLTEERCRELDLQLMVPANTALHETPFTVSVDLIGYGCTTGISASDRSKTVMALIDPQMKPADFARPGHIFPLQAKKGGVLRRTGHTEAAVDMARLAGFEPAGLIVEIMNEDGSMARLPQLREIARRFDLKIVSIADLVAYRLENESLIQRRFEMEIPTSEGKFNLVAFEQTTTGDVHLALTLGNWTESEAVLTRMHSSLLANDILHLLDLSQSPRLNNVLRRIRQEGKGVIVLMNQQQKNFSSMAQLEALRAHAQNGSMETAGKLFRMDSKDYGVGAQILRDLGVRKIRLISNAEQKRTGIVGYGLEIVSTEELPSS
jgi:3,4-dihydroxy 2-butanone 4-phosphate synthase/GTP cyclohydrolase II